MKHSILLALGTIKKSHGTVTGYRGNTMMTDISASCTASDGCTTCGACGNKTSGSFKLLISAPAIKPDAGTTVCIQHFSLNATISAIILFGFPLIVLFTTIILWTLTAPAKIETPPAILTYLIALMTGFYGAILVEKYIRHSFPPTILNETSTL